MKQCSYQPNYTIPPGEPLRETLETIGMTLAELSGRTGVPEKTSNDEKNYHCMRQERGHGMSGEHKYTRMLSWHEVAAFRVDGFLRSYGEKEWIEIGAYVKKKS